MTEPPMSYELVMLAALAYQHTLYPTVRWARDDPSPQLLAAIRGALEVEWECPECGDIYGVRDEDQPPICDMCKKAKR